MNNTQSFFTKEHLNLFNAAIENKDDIEKNNSEAILDKEKVVLENIQAIEINYSKLHNMNLLLKASIDQNNNDESQFAKESNKKINEINKLIKDTSKSNENKMPDELKDISEENHIVDMLFEFYNGVIEQSKKDKSTKSPLFNKFFKTELDKRKEEFKEQMESVNEEFYSFDEIQALNDLIENLVEL